VKKLGSKIKSNYSPDILYLTANKKINSRFYAVIEGKASKSSKDFSNPISGSIIMEEMSVNNAYDFHLVPQFVNSGTATPTQYKVVYNNSKIPQEAIAEFTFEQCFNYYNWQGAVRVPACLQCADKLSKLLSLHIQQDIKPSELQNSYYFL